MTEKLDLSVEELKALLVARIRAGEKSQARLLVRLQRAIGNELQEEDPELVAIKQGFMERTAEVMARRLYEDRRSAPLISPQDFSQLVASSLDQLAARRSMEFDDKSRAILGKLAEALYRNIYDAVLTTVSPDADPYEEQWRQLTTMRNLAAERRITPAELCALPEMMDELTRRMFTREQYIAHVEQSVKNIMDPDAVRKVTIQPLIDTIVSLTDNEDKRRELDLIVEEEMMPDIHANVEKMKTALKICFREETDRIYVSLN